MMTRNKSTDLWSSTKVSRMHNGENTVSPKKMAFEKTAFLPRKNELNPQLAPSTKINLKWIKDLNLRPETVTLLEENMGEKLIDTGLGNAFFIYNIKSKNRYVGLNLKSFCSKGNNQQNEETIYTMGENICKPYI